MKFRYSEISKGGAYANVAEQKHQGKLQFFIGGGALNEIRSKFEGGRLRREDV